MFSFSAVIAQIFNGLQFGVLIALIATGLSLIFGMLGIINFAHGSLYMFGAYIIWSFIRLFDFPGNFWFGVIISLFVMGLVGIIIERGLLRKLYNQPEVYSILITFGLLLVIQHGVSLTYGTTPLFLPIPSALNRQVNLGLFTYPFYYLFTMCLGLAVIFAVWFFLERSRLGALIRACAEDSETASTLGIKTNNVYTLTLALGSALAGLGGALHGPMIGGLTPTIGGEILLICFIVVVVGGMGSIRGALLAGVLIGILRGLAALFWAPASEFVMFVAMGFILLFRPQGLLGRGISQ
jgi:branched-chain amino acid transport system permease protein